MNPEPKPDSVPGYWRYETGGHLVPAVEKYLRAEPLAPSEVRWIAAYLRQWITAPVWRASDPDDAKLLAGLRARVDRIRTPADIGHWLHDALKLEIDPL